jgi:L-histidine N-alpha-methyltransferase
MSASRAVSPRRVSVEGVPPSDARAFARDVAEGLRARQKFLPARYLYDALGSALYDAITLLPEYYLTRAEMEILQASAGEIVERVRGAEIVELGPGSGRKTRVLLEAALARTTLVHYHPIDISESALRTLSEQLAFEYERVVVTAHCGDYRQALLRRPATADAPMLVLFLGSSIGNYEPDEAAALLRGIANALHPGDALVLGTDLKKDRAVLERAYDDELGVTAAFNRNVLARINRELDANFELDRFAFVVSYDERRAAVDSFQESLADQTVRIGALGIDVSFAAGERILTESSYKYDAASIDALAAASGLRVTASWSDAARQFSLNLLQRR